MAAIRKRTNRDGSVSFRVEVRLKGHPPESATFKRLTDARKWAHSTESAIRENRYFKTSEARRHTLNEMLERYCRDELPKKPKSIYKVRHQLDWWKEQLGDYVLADITPSLVSEQRDRLLRTQNKRGNTNTPATVNRYLAALSHAFTIAVNEWGWIEDNPLRKVKKGKESRGRVRFLSDDERARLLQACQASTNPYLYPVVIMALSTGMRSGEIMNLTWDDVDLHKGRAILHETKNSERRVVSLAGKALELLKAHARIRRLDTALLFPGKNPAKPMDLRAPWLAALKAAEIEDFRFHDLRHSAASYLAMNGASLAEIAEVLGHKTLQMVKRYSHLSEAHTANVVARMNARIFGDG